MTVSASSFSPFRLFGKESNRASTIDATREKGTPERACQNERYKFGQRILPNEHRQISINARDPGQLSAIKIIENFNSEPLFPGNGYILFNRPGRLFDEGPALAPIEALGLLNEDRSIRVRLARVRPALDSGSERLLQIVPIVDFAYHLKSPAMLITWWQTVGRNFCDGIF